MKLKTQKEYAFDKKVSAQHISNIRFKLKTKRIYGKLLIVDCAENDALFTKIAHNRKIK